MSSTTISPVTRTSAGSPPRAILICCMRLIGDVILATPLIKILKTAYPDATIDFLVNRKTGEFLEKDSRVRQVIYSEQFDIDRNVHVKGKGYFGRIFRQYDMAINLNYADRGNIAVLLAGKRWRIGFWADDGLAKSFWKRLLLTDPIKYVPDEHIAYRCKVVADALGLNAELLECKVFWDEADESKVAEVLAGLKSDGSYFVVHPFARGQYKLWPLERFVEVSDTIVEQYGLQPVWTSSPLPAEIEQLKVAALSCRHRPLIVPGIFTLNQMTCLLTGASLYVGLDTAITHLAATTGIPVVALYGPTPAVYWGPWDNSVPAESQRAIFKGNRPSRSVIMLQKEWECVPCRGMGCPGREPESRCLSEMETHEILHAVDALLQP